MQNPVAVHSQAGLQAKGWLLRSEPRLFLLSLLGMLLALAITGYGVWLWATGHVSFWMGFAIVYVGGNLAGMCSALRPGPPQLRNRLLTGFPAMAGLFMTVLFLVLYYFTVGSGMIAVAMAGMGFSAGPALGQTLFEKRLDTQVRSKRLWLAHTLLSALLFVGSIPIYTALAIHP